MTQEQTLTEIKNLVEGAELSLKDAKQLLIGLTGSDVSSDHASKAQARGGTRSEGSSQIIEGVFDGQHMVGPDGKQYSVPANYASKSKLVEGDLMKLTIDRFGNFLYKQIGPMERARLKGKLTKDESSSEWRVVADGKSYKILLASVTYFKGEEGDQVTILVPKDKSSTWGAVENIVGGAGSPDEEAEEESESISGSVMSEPLPMTPPARPEPTDDLSPLGAGTAESQTDSMPLGHSPFGSAPSSNPLASADTNTSASPTPNDQGPTPAPASEGEKDAPHFAGNVPAYSPEPAMDEEEHTTSEEASAPVGRMPLEGQGLGGGLGNNPSGLGGVSIPPSSNPAPSAPGYQELSFDDDKDEFQEI